MKQEIKFNGIIETIEEDVPLYSILNKRIIENKKLKIFKHSAGPPDIIYFVREPIKHHSYFGFKSKSQQKYKNQSFSKRFGTYHYIYGIDTSNMTSVSNYINDYIDKQKKYFKKYANNNYIENEDLKYYKLNNSNIVQAIFCSYDIFIEKDFRIIFKYPGGFDKFYFYNGHQNDYDVTEDELRTIFLSSILRTWCFNGENLNNSYFMEEIKNENNFNSLIDSIIYILVERLEYKYPNLERKIGLLMHWFMKFLMDTRRYSFILTYFSKMSYVDTNLTQYALKPLYYINGYKDGLQFISTLLTSNTNPLLLCFEIEFLTILEKYEHAMKLGKYLTVLNPGFNEAWIKMAELYLKLKKYNKCLKALNNLNYLKIFLDMDNINYNNPFIVVKEYKNIYVKEIPLADIDKDKSNKNNINYKINVSSIIKYNDLLYCSKHNIDFFYNSTFLLFSENDDLIKDIINKIINSRFLKFNKEQKKLYYILLQMIKEINFTKFLELKNEQFSSLKNSININKTDNDINNNEQMEEKSNSNLSNSLDNLFINKINSSQNTSNLSSNEIEQNLLKTLINPFLEMVIDTLIEDIKLFSLGSIQREKTNINHQNFKNKKIQNNNNKYAFGNILNKNNLSKSEIKFCIIFGILCERLKYFKIAFKYYIKASNYCFSKFVHCRIIKILLKIKDYKNCILKLNNYLLHYNSKEFYYACKTPLWIDKIILEILYEYQANDILGWIKPESTKEIVNFIKQIVNKYKMWVENGHEFHLLK